MKYCAQCGQPVKDGAKFCSHCGHRFPVIAHPEKKDDLPQDIKEPSLAPEKEQQPETDSRAGKEIAARDGKKTVVYQQNRKKTDPARGQKPASQQGSGRQQSSNSQQGSGRQQGSARQTVTGGRDRNIDRQDSEKQNGTVKESGQAGLKKDSGQSSVRQPRIVPESPSEDIKEEKRAGKNALSIVLLILAALFLTYSVLVFRIRDGFSPEALSSAVDQIDVPSMTVNVEDVGVTTVKKYVSRYVIDSIENQELKAMVEGNIDSVYKLLKKPYIKDQIKSVLSRYSEFLLNRKTLDPVSQDSVKDFFEKYKDKLYEDSNEMVYYIPKNEPRPTLGFYLEEKDINGFFDDLGTDEINASYLKRTLGVDPSLIQIMLSGIAAAVSLALAVICWGLIVFINRKRLSSAGIFIGISLLAAGILLTGVQIAGKNILAGSGFSAAEVIGGGVLDKMLPIGLGICAAGLVLEVISIVLRVVYKKKNNVEIGEEG